MIYKQSKGFSTGAPIDPSHCKEAVSDGSRWMTWHQCKRKAKIDGWCTQHHPDTIKRKYEERMKGWKAKQEAGIYPRHRRLYKAVKVAKQKISQTINLMEREGCTHSGCDDGRHTYACPLGYVDVLKQIRDSVLSSVD